MTKRRLTELSEEVVRKLAYIVGPSSAAALAIADFERRKAAGEQVAFYQEGNAILVGPDVRAAISAAEQG